MPVVEWLGQPLNLPEIPPRQIVTFLLAKQVSGAWQAVPSDLLED
jgi:hypothetical protein